MPQLSKKLKRLIKRSVFPIKYNEKNSKILLNIYESLDKEIPLRELVRRMIMNIDDKWDSTYSSLYLSALRYVYSVFLAHSDNDTSFSVVGRTYELLCDPYEQDFIKDYPLMRYRQEAIMFPEGDQWISSPQFEMIEDEPDISFCTPWEYEVDDYKYAFEPFDSEKYADIIRYLTAKMVYLLQNKRKFWSRVIDLSKLSHYISDTSFFVPEETYSTTKRKIDHLDMSMLLKEIRSPTLKVMEFIRKPIYVSPNNIRDTFIPSWKTFCALFVLESLCDEIIPVLPEVRIGKVNSELRYTSRYYIMVDIKKFGIMFPKEVILSVIEGLERIFSVNLEYIKSAYKNYVLYIDGEATYPCRGFGLGNMNKLATIAHYIIAKESGLKFYVYSDDIVYMLDKEPSLDVLSRMRTYYENFGMTLNIKKCYISNHWEFLGESSHDFYDYVENNKCISMFMESFFSPTLLIGEMREKSALAIYSQCRDLWLKNHEINPILREDLILYPESMGGFVRTNQPLSYCEQADLTPSLFTSIRSPPSKFIIREIDEFYSTGSQVDYYLNSIVRTFHIDERRKMSNWKLLQFWIKEEKRYVRADIGNKGLHHVIQFGIDHLDLPDYLLKFRSSPSQLKGYVEVPKMLRKGNVPCPFPIISVRQSDELLLKKLSVFTDFPLYTKYMLELKKKRAIMDILYDPPNQSKKYLNEMALALYFTQVNSDTFNFEVPEKVEFEPISYEELDLDYIQSLAVYREEDHDDVALEGLYEFQHYDEDEEEIDIEDEVDLDEL